MLAVRATHKGGAGQTVVPNGGALRFRGFQVVPEARVLLEGGRVVEIGGRAFDILVVLLESRGRIISKRDLISRVWPSTVVDDCNLRFQLSQLRKVLGTHRDAIKTISGRGYMLATDLGCEAMQREPALTSAASSDAPSMASCIDDQIAILKAENVELRRALATLAIGPLSIAAAGVHARAESVEGSC